LKTSDTISAPPALLPAMDHQDAVRQMAVEKFLLNELTPTVREEFEQHFFECQECAAELRATSAFLDEAKKQLGEVVHRPAAERAQKSWAAWLFRPAFVAPVFASMLLLIVYQNFIGTGARLDAPEIIRSASLVGGNSRGTISPISVADGKPMLLSVDVPAQDQYSSYELALLSPAGATLWRVPVSAEEAVDTVSLRVPTTTWVPGEYRLIVFGHFPGAKEPRELAHYRFNVSNDPKVNTGR
jgi:hypothetical protein